MKLRELIGETELTLIQGNLNCSICSLAYHSGQVQPGSLFVCITGTTQDAHHFIPQALDAGAVALVVENPDICLTYCISASITVLYAKDTRIALAALSSAWFGHPAKRLTTIGITGTKGKTTTAYLIKSILEQAGHQVGLISTIEVCLGDKTIPSENTTPESYLIQEYLHHMTQSGCDSVIMEVSSQALKQHRTGGLLFDYGIFTNLEPDHIGPNEHPDLEDYIACKSQLFRQCRLGIINLDSPYASSVLLGHTCILEGYQLCNTDTDTPCKTAQCNQQELNPRTILSATGVHLWKKPAILGTNYHVSISDNEEWQVEVSVPGYFSIYNSLAAIALCRHLNVPKENVLSALKQVHVKGRVEILPLETDFPVILDYAHNAMSLENLLTTLRAYTHGRIICLFGCGGNRDKSRRYEMGAISARLSDMTIVTSDNPRWENPMEIIQDILDGITSVPDRTLPDKHQVITIPDRKEAIRYGLTHAMPEDILIVAGKGHETYQEIEGVKYPMDDRIMIQTILEEERTKGNQYGETIS